MFGHQFYPTPSSLAQRMLEPYRDLLKGAAVIDPSPGKGDLLKAAGYMGAKRLYAVEIDPDLRSILSENKINLVGEDFLEYQGNYLFDVCVMNPPFDNGAKHLLKAWRDVKAQHYVCLLNAETIRNPFASDRELLTQIIADNDGSVEFIQNAFSNALRKTDVEVALVRLEKKETQRLSFDGLQTGANATNADFDFSCGSLPSNMDVIDSLIIDYNAAASALSETITAASKLQYFTRDFWGYGIEAPHFKKPSESDRDQYNNYLDTLRRAAWNQVFRRSKISHILTTKAKDDFDKFQKQHGVTEFTRNNIIAFFNMIYDNRKDIMSRCIIEAFDVLTAYDKQNRVHPEGWKTNDYYQVNKKVILPFFGEYGRYHYRDKLDDIDKALCSITGIKFEPYYGQKSESGFISTWEAIDMARRNPDKTASSTFFDLKGYLKGTVHLTFKNRDLLDRFNIEACKGKGWIADNFTKSHTKRRKASA